MGEAREGIMEKGVLWLGLEKTDESVSWQSPSVREGSSLVLRRDPALPLLLFFCFMTDDCV